MTGHLAQTGLGREACAQECIWPGQMHSWALMRSTGDGRAPAGRACDGWVDSWRRRLDVPAECASVRDPRPGGREGRLISGTGMRMGADARLVACSGRSSRPVLAVRMSSRALLLACTCPARCQAGVISDKKVQHRLHHPPCHVFHSDLIHRAQPLLLTGPCSGRTPQSVEFAYILLNPLTFAILLSQPNATQVSSGISLR